MRGEPELFDEPDEAWRGALRGHLGALPAKTIRAAVQRLRGLLSRDLDGAVALASQRMARQRELAAREIRTGEQAWSTSFWLELDQGRVSYGEVHRRGEEEGRLFVAHHIYRWGDRYLMSATD